jgi:RNA polymerase sigma factor (sigma-70 family)
MANRPAESVLQTLCKIVETQSSLSDGQLLRQFATTRDEGAFAALLQRHSGLVYSVCRNILRHEHDAEDAFQGTFLVLARRAGAIRQEKAIGSWLYRVAYRVAMKARKAAERRRERENQTAKTPEDQSPGELAWRELQAMLDEELNRLPEKYRTPFVLCCLTGKSKSEAAAELGWKEGTVSSRLAQARKLLQSRLARRGVSLSALLSGLAITAHGAAAAVPAELLARTRALAFAVGDAPASGAPALLAEGVLRGMTLTRLKATAALLILAGLVGTATAVMLDQPADTPDPQPPAVAAVAPPDKVGPADAIPAKVMIVSGSVVGADGKPVPGARVAIVAGRRAQPRDILDNRSLRTHLLGDGPTDEQGRYRINVPQTTESNYGLTAVASAPGHAMSSRAADPTAITEPDHTIPLQLVRGRDVRVRLIDAANKPANGVLVHVLAMSRGTMPGLILTHYEPPVALPGWPASALTDDNGSVVFRDITPGTLVVLQARDDRFAREWLRFRTGDDDLTKPVELTLAPGRLLEGRVLARDTGAVVPNATVVVETTVLEHNYYSSATTRTDDEGRYRLQPFAGENLTISVYPPDETPYLVAKKEFGWPEKKVRHEVDVSLLRGILVRGTVLEAGSGKPVAGASVTHEWGKEDNPFFDGAMKSRENPWPTRGATTRSDGRFSMAVPPGPGFLLVKAAEPDYLHVETSSGRLVGGVGGTPTFVSGLFELKLLPDDPPQECLIAPRRGATLRGRVVDADGQPVASAVIVAPTYVPEGMELKGHTLPVRDGRFEIPGVEPGAKLKVACYDKAKKQGAVVELTPSDGSESVIKLAPCVSARVRFSGPATKVPGAQLRNELIFRPGPAANDTFQTGETAGLFVATDRVFGAAHRPARVAAGEYLISNLIPGAGYSVIATINGFQQTTVTFTAPAAGATEPSSIAIEPLPISKD